MIILILGTDTMVATKRDTNFVLMEFILEM